MNHNAMNLNLRLPPKKSVLKKIWWSYASSVGHTSLQIMSTSCPSMFALHIWTRTRWKKALQFWMELCLPYNLHLHRRRRRRQDFSLRQQPQWTWICRRSQRRNWQRWQNHKRVCVTICAIFSSMIRFFFMYKISLLILEHNAL